MQKKLAALVGSETSDNGEVAMYGSDPRHNLSEYAFSM
jgi:hypothetical protein